MNRSLVLALGAATLALFAPTVGALSVDPGLTMDGVHVDVHDDGSVTVHADSPPVALQGPAAAEGPVLAPRAQPAGADMGVAAEPQQGRAAWAAAGTAVGIGLIVVAWNYLKYGAFVGLGGALFSRIDAHRILDNDVRSKVHEAIGANPGITIKEVTQIVGIGWGTAVYHLARLEQERLVVSERHRQFRRYFRNGGGVVNDDKTAFAELKNPTTQRLAQEILDHPGRAQKDLCERVGISAPLAHKHLSRLEHAQLLTKQREWKTVKYFPTGKLAGLLPTGPAAAATPVAAPTLAVV